MKIALTLLSASAVAGIGALVLLIFGEGTPITPPRMATQPPVLAQEAPAPVAPPAASAVTPTPMKEEIARLKTENLDLKRALAKLSWRLDVLESEITEQKDSDGMADQEVLENAQPSPSREENSEIALSALADALAAETPDRHWARAAEVEIETAFQDGDPTGGDLISTECRRTLCRAEVQFNTLAERNRGLERLSLLLAFADSAVALPVAESPSAYLFLAREGYALPTLQD